MVPYENISKNEKKNIKNRPTLSGFEAVALRIRQEAKPEAAEVKMLSFFLTRIDGIRNEDIIGTESVRCFGETETGRQEVWRKN